MRRGLKYIVEAFIIFSFFLIAFINANAQSAKTEKKWHYLTDIYILFPNIEGETGIGDIEAPIDANPGDIFSKLKMGGMLYFEAHNSKWTITSDLVFMNLNQDVTPGKAINSGDVTSKQLIWEVDGLYRLTPYFEAGLGGRLNNLQAGIDINRNTFPNGTENVSGDKSATWFDPLIAARLATDIDDKWLFQFRADAGGFGIGSDFTWQLQAYAGYRFTKVFQITAGYRFLSIDYDKLADNQEFKFDVNEYGPLIRFGFNF